MFVDPTVPRLWWPAIVSGVEEWNDAFIRLGYKNSTIRAVTPDSTEWPRDYSVGNVRWNTISMVANPATALAIGKSSFLVIIIILLLY